jgi:hypothetical protein
MKKTTGHLQRVITFRQICEYFNADYRHATNVFARIPIPESYIVYEVGSHIKKYRIEILEYLKGLL